MPDTVLLELNASFQLVLTAHQGLGLKLLQFFSTAGNLECVRVVVTFPPSFFVGAGKQQNVYIYQGPIFLNSFFRFQCDILVFNFKITEF